MIVKELFAKLGLEVDEGAFSVGEKAIGILKEGLIAVGATATGAALGLAALAKKTADAGMDAWKTSQKVGTSAQAWQELKFAAADAADALQLGLGFLSRTAYAAAHGSGEAAYSFQQLGVKIQDANGNIRPTDHILEDIAARFARMPDGINKTALAMHVFGRGGKELIPFLNKGRDGIEALREEARELGVVLDTGTILASKHFKKALHQAEGSIQGLAYAIGGPLIDAFTPALEAIALWVKDNRQWIATKIHEAIRFTADAASRLWSVVGPLVKLLGRVAFSTVTWKLALFALGTYMTVLAGQNLLSLISAVKMAVFWFNVAGAASLRAAISSLGAWLAAAAPLVAIVALAGLIFLVFEDLYTYLQGGDSVFGQLADAMWNVLPKAWDRVVGYFKQKWEEFSGWLTNSTIGQWFNKIMGSVAGGASIGEQPTAFDEYGTFGPGAQSPTASVGVSPSSGGKSVTMSTQIGDINVTSGAGADSRQVGNDVADVIEERQRTMLREAQTAVVSG